jgi:hypothetical protein
MTKFVSEVLNSLTKEMFEIGRAEMPKAFSKELVGIDKEYINVINALQIIKAMPGFLEEFGEKFCVHKFGSGEYVHTYIEYSSVRLYSESIYYDEDGSVIDDIPTEYVASINDIGGIQTCLIHNLLNDLSPRLLELLRANIAPGIVSEEEWEVAEILVNKYYKLHKVAEVFQASPESFMHEENLPKMLIQAAEKIDSLVEDGDVVIFVGNTPQMIRYPFDKMTFEGKPHLQTVSLAISGHPGLMMEGRRFDASLKNILTNEQHELYKDYMQDMGLTAREIQGKKIHFVDCVGAGGGITYQMKCLAEIAYGGNISEAQQHFHVISTNNSKGGGALHGRSFVSGSFQTDTTSLDMDKLTGLLDRVSDDQEAMRLMPSSKSYKWSPEFMIELHEASRNIFKEYNDSFAQIFAQIDESTPRIDVVFANAVKHILHINPDLDAEEVVHKIAAHFSGEVFTSEHQEACSAIITPGLWDILAGQAAIPGNPEGFMDLAGILCHADLSFLEA